MCTTEKWEKKQHWFPSDTIVRYQLINKVSRSLEDSHPITTLPPIIMKRKISYWIYVYWLCGCLYIPVISLISSLFHAIKYDKHNCWFMKFMCLPAICLWKPCVYLWYAYGNHVFNNDVQQWCNIGIMCLSVMFIWKSCICLWVHMVAENRLL